MWRLSEKNFISFALQLKDLLYFLIIFAFVILGVGIYYHALRFQNFVPRSEWTEWQIWSILYYPYWQTYAEFNLEYLSGKVIFVESFFILLRYCLDISFWYIVMYWMDWIDGFFLSTYASNFRFLLKTYLVLFYSDTILSEKKCITAFTQTFFSLRK